MSQKNSVSPIDWREETDTWISKNESKFESNQQEFLEMGLLNKTFRMSLQSKVFDYTDSSQEFCFHAQKHKTNGLESSVNLWIFQGVCVWGGSWLDRIKKRQYDLFLKEGGWMSVTVSNLHALRLFPLVSHSPYLQSSHLRLEEARNTSGQLPHVVYG